MSDVQWTNGQFGAEDFRIEQGALRPITGALWTAPDATSQTPLVLCGHGASGDRYQAPIPHLARRFGTERGWSVLSIDGPVHGLRQVGVGGREAFAEEMQSKTSQDDMVSDWHRGVATMAAERQLGQSALGYFGLSMGTIFGIPLLASELQITASAIGLCGSNSIGRYLGGRLLADAAAITHPLVFIMQLEDELFDRAGYLDLFDALASHDKRLHANPGLHAEVPAEEIAYVFDFLSNHLGEMPPSPSTLLAT